MDFAEKFLASMRRYHEFIDCEYFCAHGETASSILLLNANLTGAWVERPASVDDGEFGRLSGRVFDGAENQERAIVVGRNSHAAEFVGGAKDCAGNILHTRICRKRGNQVGEPFYAKFLVLGIL